MIRNESSRRVHRVVRGSSPFVVGSDGGECFKDRKHSRLNGTIFHKRAFTISTTIRKESSSHVHRVVRGSSRFAVGWDGGDSFMKRNIQDQLGQLFRQEHSPAPRPSVTTPVSMSTGSFEAAVHSLLLAMAAFPSKTGNIQETLVQLFRQEHSPHPR